MKIAFSTRDVQRPSFSSLCRFAADYGMDGIEIWNASEERQSHSDSILRAEMVSEARNKLRNNRIEVCALTYPLDVESDEASPISLVQYVDMAALAGIENVIVHVSSMPDEQAPDAVRYGVEEEVGRPEHPLRHALDVFREHRELVAQP